MITALIVDDTVLFRSLVGAALQKVPGLSVVGTAPNGRIALAKIMALVPDIVTLDIEMPEMNGLEVLKALAEKNLDTAVIVVSSLTTRGGELTMRALELGAFDYVIKPQGPDGMADFERSLTTIIGSLAKRREIAKILKGVARGPRVERSIPQRGPLRVGSSEIVAIGVSTGGPQALLFLLPSIAADFPVPILIVQHMPALFTANLARSLAAKCLVKVKEAENGEVLRKGTVYIAPGGYQMKVALGADAVTKIVRVTEDPPENNCRPSADYLFRSVAHLYFGRATGVVLTGMGSDGKAGIEGMKRAGALVIAQDEATCVVYGMPKAVVDAGMADLVLPLGGIAAAIVESVN